MTIGGTIRFSLHLCSFADITGQDLLGARRTIFLKTLVQKDKCRQAKHTERRHGRPKQHIRSKVDIAPRNEEDEGGLFSLGCGIPSQDRRQRYRDNKEITTPSVLDTAGEQAAAWLPERVHPKRTKQAL